MVRSETLLATLTPHALQVRLQRDVSISRVNHAMGHDLLLGVREVSQSPLDSIRLKRLIH